MSVLLTLAEPLPSVREMILKVPVEGSSGIETLTVVTSSKRFGDGAYCASPSSFYNPTDGPIGSRHIETRDAVSMTAFAVFFFGMCPIGAGWYLTATDITVRSIQLTSPAPHDTGVIVLESTSSREHREHGRHPIDLCILLFSSAEQ